MKYRIHFLPLLAVLAMLLVACGTQAEDNPPDRATAISGNGAETSSAETEDQKVEPTIEPTVAPTVEPEPTVEPSPTPEATEEPESSSIEGFDDYTAEALSIQVAHPDQWLVKEDPELGLILESAEGYFDAMPDVEGAGLIILPRDELAEEEIVEALRLSVFNLGPPPTIFIEFPTVSTVGDHDVATAAFRESESGTEGFYVFIQNEEHGVFVFAVTSGLAKVEFLDLLESVIGTVVLG